MFINKENKNKLLMILSIPLAIIIICIGTSIGSSDININEIISIIINKTFSVKLDAGIEAKNVSIIWNIRLPRVLLAFTVGGALSASGAVVQSILKNSLASPYTIGISSGASLGVGILIASGAAIPFLGNFSLALVGFICSLLTMVVVINFSSKLDKALSSNTIILMGMVISLFLNAVLTTITVLFTNKLEAITMWQMGSFSLRGWSYLKVGIPFFILGIAGIMFFTKEMDILTFGEEEAMSMGVEAKKVKKYLLFFVAILTGTAVAISGIIGFVDLIIPHIVRKVFGSRNIYIIPMSVIFGGAFMVITDLVSRVVIIPSEIPVGAVTAVIGAPFFAYLYFKKSK